MESFPVLERPLFVVEFLLFMLDIQYESSIFSQQRR